MVPYWCFRCVCAHGGEKRLNSEARTNRNPIKDGKYCETAAVNLNDDGAACGCWSDYVVKVILLCSLSKISCEI